MSKSTLKILPALVAASLLVTLSARAQPAPGPTSDIVFIDGAPHVTLQDTPGQSQLALAFISLNGAQPGAVLFYQDASMTVLSDQLWTDGQTLNFASDPDLQDLGTLPVFARLVETGAPQDVGGFFGFGSNFLLVQSDAEVPDTGTTFCLFGLSLMGLGFLHRKLC